MKEIIIENSEIDINKTFECGQCFRWEQQIDGSYVGVAFNRAAKIKKEDNKLIIKSSKDSDTYEFWENYLDLKTDYIGIKNTLKKLDSNMLESVEYGDGIHLLKQELSEVLFSFIISANNNIPRIKKIIEAFCKSYGNKINFLDKTLYTFPDIESIKSTTIEKLTVLRAGYREKYIYKTASLINDIVLLEKELKEMGTNDARTHLKKFHGIGDKVADCILLFSGIKLDVFPTDTWVKKVMGKYYLNGNSTLKSIRYFADDYFKELQGYAQQYLFYYARENADKLGYVSVR